MYAMLTITCLLAVPPESLQVEKAAAVPELDALFQRTSGWIGADGNYSITLSSERTLWFFSDTWIGDIERGKRRNAKLINNSVGVMTTAADKRAVEYYWDKEKKSAFFQPDDKTGWLWPFAGTFIAGKVHLFLWQMDKAKGPAAFAFGNVAVWHAIIENPFDDPAKWNIKQTKLPFTELEASRHIFFGSAVMVHDQHTYIYGTLEKPKERGSGKKMVLARVESENLADFSKWRFRTFNGWSNDFHKVEPLTDGVASEYSVLHTPALKRFVMVTHEAFLSPKIVARSAEQPWGPWSEPVKLFACPEAEWKKDIFCYSGKAHAGLSAKDELVLTYAANSQRMADVLDDPRLYWPRFVTVRLAKSP